MHTWRRYNHQRLLRISVRIVLTAVYNLVLRLSRWIDSFRLQWNHALLLWSVLFFTCLCDGLGAARHGLLSDIWSTTRCSIYSIQRHIQKRLLYAHINRGWYDFGLDQRLTFLHPFCFMGHLVFWMFGSCACIDSTRISCHKFRGTFDKTAFLRNFNYSHARHLTLIKDYKVRYRLLQLNSLIVTYFWFPPSRAPFSGNSPINDYPCQRQADLLIFIRTVFPSGRDRFGTSTFLVRLIVSAFLIL